jgi:uracil-DNA glycosylase family 4
MDYPQEIREQLAAYLRQLQRKGIRSIYIPEDDGSSDTTDEEKVMPKTKSPGSALDKLADTVSGCIACPLHESRTQTVFGDGSPGTKVLFIGEAPGRDEDLQGIPFVGRAGQLLNKILAAIELRREDVYITNILKCRPPNNRDPQEPEVRQCENYLKQQIQLIQPKVICALGRISAQWLLQTNAPLGTLRSGEYYYEGIRILPTYHPAALLRNPAFKKPAWEDFKQLKAMLDDS